MICPGGALVGMVTGTKIALMVEPATPPFSQRPAPASKKVEPGIASPATANVVSGATSKLLDACGIATESGLATKPPEKPQYPASSTTTRTAPSDGVSRARGESSDTPNYTRRMPADLATAKLAASGTPLDATAQVLVVDDEPNVRDVVTKTLENLGCRVIAADSGAAALELAATRAFDVVLTDIIMPGMSGIELVETLRRDGFSTGSVSPLAGQCQAPSMKHPARPSVGRV